MATHGKVYSAEIISQVLDRYERGQPITFIAFALGINHKTVARLLHERGTKMRRGTPPGRMVAPKPKRVSHLRRRP